jgi:hypothetical protein
MWSLLFGQEKPYTDCNCIPPLGSSPRKRQRQREIETERNREMDTERDGDRETEECLLSCVKADTTCQLSTEVPSPPH